MQTPARNTAYTLTGTLLVCLLAVFAVIWFGPLDIRHLVPNDEGRYAEMAREVFTTGDWITPRYNGYKYFEKPPLQTWANALTYMVFGLGAWQARLYTALTGFAGVLLLGYTVAKLYGRRTGLYAAAILASAPYWNALGHYDTLDMGLSFWMEVVFCSLLLAQCVAIGVSQRRAWMTLCWAAMAMAILSKGLIGLILPGSVLIVFSLLTANWRLWLRLHPFIGVSTLLIITLPWFVLVQRDNPDFFHVFFIVQQFQRYLTPDQHRPGPIYYFVPILLGGLLPWITLPFTGASHRDGLLLRLRTGLSQWRSAGRQGHFSAEGFATVWAVFIFAFFSVSHSKLLPYVLPVVPALVVLLACCANHMPITRWRQHLKGYLVFLIIAALASFALRFQGNAGNPAVLFKAFQVWVLAGIAFAAAATALAIRWCRTHEDMPRTVLAVAFGWFGLCTIAGNGHEMFDVRASGARLAPEIRAALAKLPADTPFYMVDTLDHTVPFYIGHTMIMVQGPDELGYGVHAEPQKWIPTVDDWMAQWRGERYAMALLKPGVYERIAATGLPMRVVARDDRRVIVEKPADTTSESSVIAK